MSMFKGRLWLWLDGVQNYHPNKNFFCKLVAAKVGECQFLLGGIDGFVGGLFQNFLFVKKWHSLDIHVATINIKAH